MEDMYKHFKQFVSHCKYEKNLCETTIKAYEADFMQYLRFINEELNEQTELRNGLDKAVLRNYIEMLMKKYKVKSVKRKIATLKAFLNFMEYEEIIQINPFRKIRLKLREPFILPNVLSLSEIKKIFRAAYRDYCTIKPENEYLKLEIVRNIAVLELLFGTGIRVSELCSLTTNNVNLKNKFIVVYGKGSKERILHICNTEVISILLEYNRYVSLKNPERNYFFINRFNNRLSEQSVRYLIKKYVNKTNIKKKVTPHTFRHTFATLLLEADVDIKYIQHLLGHSSIITTQIYTHVNKRKQKKILETKHPRKDFSMDYGGSNE